MEGAGRRHYGATNRHNLCQEWWQGQRLGLQSTQLPLSAPRVPHGWIHSRALTASKIPGGKHHRCLLVTARV